MSSLPCKQGLCHVPPLRRPHLSKPPLSHSHSNRPPLCSVRASRSTAPAHRRAGRRLDLVVDLQQALRHAVLCCAMTCCAVPAVLCCAVEVCLFPLWRGMSAAACNYLSSSVQSAPAPTPLHPMSRQPELNCLLGLADEELQDAWVLLEPRHDPEEPQTATHQQAAQQQQQGGGWRSKRGAQAPAAAPAAKRR